MNCRENTPFLRGRWEKNREFQSIKFGLHTEDRRFEKERSIIP